MKLIPIFILAFIIFTGISLAQQEEVTTISNPEQLRTIFEFRQNGTAPVELYSTIRGRELSLGDVSGTIAAEPPLNMRIRNGAYYLVTEDISIAVYGDMIITKPAQDKIYPLITLLNGTIEAYQMEFDCSRECNTITIDANTGDMNLDGNAQIITPELEDIGIVKINISNLNFRPNPTISKAPINLSFYVPETEESKINKITVKGPSNGGYTYIIGTSEVTSRLIIRELISGNVHISDLPNPSNNWIRPSEGNEIILGYAQNELATINKGLLLYLNNNQFNTCKRSTTHNCMYYNPEINEADILIRNKFIMTMSLDNERLSNIKLGQFNFNDIQSRLILKKASLGNRKIIFKNNDVIVDGNWVDFGISFSAYIYRESERRFDQLECRYNGENPSESKCYLNNMEISLPSSARTAARCRNNAECNSGQTCKDNWCIESRGCRLLIESQSRDPALRNTIDLLFVGNGMSGIQEVEQETRKLIYGIDSLFETEPFKSNENKFNIWVMNTAPLRGIVEENPNMPLTLIPIEEGVPVGECPEADVTILLSKQKHRSYGAFGPKICRVSIASAEFQNKRTLIHEIGHCFGELYDEYYIMIPGKSGIYGIPNCIAPKGNKRAEDIALQEWTRLLRMTITEGNPETKAAALVERASTYYRGCGSECDSRCENYLKPSEFSIMNTQYLLNYGYFNDISSLYLQEKINDNTLIDTN